MRALLAIACLTAASPARAVEWTAGLLGITNATVPLPSEVEGEAGFAVPHLRLGVAARGDHGVRAVAVIDAITAEGLPLLTDGYVELRPDPAWRLRAGFLKTPLCFSGRDTTLDWGVAPEGSAIQRAFYPGRDLGVGIEWRGDGVPLEAYLHVGNGGGGIAGNDNFLPAAELRADVVLGRARPGAADEGWGLRAGAGVHLDSTFDRAGIAGRTAGDFTYWRAPTVSGPRTLAEAHAVLLAGPFTAIAEAAWASEGRLKDTDGNPTTPRVPQAPVRSAGASLELDWRVAGPARHLPDPMAVELLDAGQAHEGAIDLSLRLDRLSLGGGAEDLVAGGGDGATLAARWWLTEQVSVAAAGYLIRYDRAPIEEPGVTISWVAQLRLVAVLR